VTVALLPDPLDPPPYLAVAQGRPAPRPPGQCACGHGRGDHRAMRAGRARAFGCSSCLCLTQPADIRTTSAGPSIAWVEQWSRACDVASEAVLHQFNDRGRLYQ
jgi:hypothetical protein